MKNLLYTLIALFSLTACRSVNKLVEKGKYDEALIVATKRLAGKKNKKTKHVKALEKAFAELTKRDMDLIAFYDGKNNPSNLDKIISITNKIERRQARVRPFLPLISKEGYEARFTFVDNFKIKSEALDAAAAYNYGKAENVLNRFFETKDKALAREAYRLFDRVEDYRKDFRNTNALKRDAFNFGQIYIHVSVVNESNSYLPARLNSDIERIASGKKYGIWRNYVTSAALDSSFDYTATLVLDGIDVSPERESVSHRVDKKRIKTGWQYAKNKKGEFKRDSLGNKIKEDVFKMVRAEITEIFREKEAFVTARLYYKNNWTGEIIGVRPLASSTDFKDYAVSFRGDRRALCERSLERLKNRPLPFPNDLELIFDASENLKALFLDELDNMPI